MIIDNDSSAMRLAADVYGADRVKALARTDQKAAIREVAQQFEALLMNTVLKSMRETTAQDGLFDNEQTRLYMSLLDQQISQNIAKRGLGLADVLERQLSGLVTGTEPDAWEPVADTQKPRLTPWDLSQLNASSARPAPGLASATLSIHPPAIGTGQVQPLAGAAISTEELDVESEDSVQARPGATAAESIADNPANVPARESADGYVQGFIDDMLPHARAAAQTTGIPAQFLIGHAALESGWGRYQIRNSDGSPSHNLFGIKADSRWSGEVTQIVTTEYVAGLPLKRVEQFRAYGSYEAAFQDYADFLASNPRYARALQATHDARAFASELQSAGYATDPHYADKLTAVINGRSLRGTVLT